MKQVFANAIAANDTAAFLAAAALHGVKPNAVLPYASEDGIRVAKDGFQVFICALSQIDSTPAGVHDGIRDGGSSRITKKAETLAFLVSDLAKCKASDVAYFDAVYRTETDAWVFVCNGVSTDAITWGELAPIAEQARYQRGFDGGFVSWLKNLEIESMPA